VETGAFKAMDSFLPCSGDKNNFQPRVGLAWSPRYSSGFLHTLFGDQDRTVVRLSFAEMTMMAYGNVSLDSLNFDGVNLFYSNHKRPGGIGFCTESPARCSAQYIATGKLFWSSTSDFASSEKTPRRAISMHQSIANSGEIMSLSWASQVCTASGFSESAEQTFQ